ncbi:uncharacterized protein TRIADDRAFT_52611 [Trichoplax adhaerens]|uniref:Leucine-rich repeat and coiled-coil domain-containing protein 1 n=1 Tax=Trichoplax adhaerens TaxID=10228 RepID=B3RJF9_TRIAD|nr:hypothetical protein TRIADDRAFT_52611 [Trichoplax adhaerens]EDV29087.1 hypothetical protein TRIADDRAFT_52611 [Trichoplax adhaerens]|eukprot:XP_002108289.1 hypothetical protein TRIADDRAFT_52611 [Trichoplax adhaerens]
MDEDNKKQLCLIDEGINSLHDLKLDPKLTILNLHCNRIKQIENLLFLHQLYHLDLSSNSITQIAGLDSLVSLRILNLACNKIKVVENLQNLRLLTKLNLAYNEIDDVSGFQDMAGPDYRISHIDLRANFIRNLSHLINCISNLSNIRELQFQHGSEELSDNPMCKQDGYREKIFQALQPLEILDGFDRSGKLAAEFDNKDVPGVEEYLEYLMSTSSSSSVKEAAFQVKTPKINAAIDKFYQRGTKLISEVEDNKFQKEYDLNEDTDGIDDQLPPAMKPLIVIKNEKKSIISKTIRKSSENTAESTDENYAKYWSLQTTSASDDRRNNLQRETSSKENIESDHEKFNRHMEKKKPSLKKSNLRKTKSERLRRPQPLKMNIVHLGDNRDSIDKEGSIPANITILKELDAEKERRWKAEMAARKLVDHIQNLQRKLSASEKTRYLAIDTSAKLQRIVEKEHNEKIEEQQKLLELQSNLEQVQQQLEACKASEEDRKSEKESMEKAYANLEISAREQFLAKDKDIKVLQDKVRDMSTLVAEANAAKDSYQKKYAELEKTIVDQAEENRKQMSKMISRDSSEFQEAINRERVHERERFDILVNQMQERIATPHGRYACILLSCLNPFLTTFISNVKIAKINSRQLLKRLKEKDREIADLNEWINKAVRLDAEEYDSLSLQFERCVSERNSLKLDYEKKAASENRLKSLLSRLVKMTEEQRTRLNEVKLQNSELKRRMTECEKRFTSQINLTTLIEKNCKELQEDNMKLTTKVTRLRGENEGLKNENERLRNEVADKGQLTRMKYFS